MGFFSDLKEDLSQAVNEFKSDSDVKEDILDLADGLPEVNTAADESDDDFEASLDEDLADILDGLDESYEAAKVDAYKETDSEATVMESIPEMPMEVAEAGAVEEAPVVPQRVVSNELSVIMDSMIINGNMATEGSLEVRGSVVGNVEALGKLNITGKIQGNSTAAEIFADGAKINGEIRSTGIVKIGQTTTIIGNVYATSAVVAGAVKGDIDVQGPVILDSTAIVLGNIKSKAVQINNGAVIEGMCSQCYAEVNPTSFFEELKKAK